MRAISNLLVALALGFAAWYGYTNFIADTSGAGASDPDSGYNCRSALAQLAEDYRCRDDAGCELRDEDLEEIQVLEKEIERYCN
jgi:hypothetical protein